MYEFETIFLVALFFLIVYFVGSHQNRKIGVKYAKAIKEHMTSRSEYVGFHPYGRGGFRSLCRMKDSGALTKVEMAVTLVDRENLMHYPLSLLTRDCDRLVCWGYLKEVTSADIEIVQKLDQRALRKITLQKQLQEVAIHEGKLEESLTFLSSDPDVAKRFLSDSQVRKYLMEAKNFIKRLSLNHDETRVYLIGELTDTSLKPLLDLLFCCGEQHIRVQ